MFTKTINNIKIIYASTVASDYLSSGFRCIINFTIYSVSPNLLSVAIGPRFERDPGVPRESDRFVLRPWNRKTRGYVPPNSKNSSRRVCDKNEF